MTTRPTNEQIAVAVYFSLDPAAGDLAFHDTQQSAFDCAAESLKEYRSDARANGEWALDVDNVTVGILPAGATREAACDDYGLLFITHRAKAIGNDKMGYDYRMCAIPSAAFLEVKRND